MQHLTILIKPASSLCNMRCEYCFYHDVASQRAVPSYGIMTDDVLDTLIRRAFAFAEKSVSFVFQGGEPTVAGIDFFKRAIAYQKKYNSRRIAVYNTIQTNATLITDALAEFFKNNGFLVGVSLDGDRVLNDKYRRLADGSGSYDSIVRGIDLLKKHGVDFNVLAVITRESAKSPSLLYSALKEYKYLQFIPLIDAFGKESSDFSLNAEDYGRFLCEAFELYYRDIMDGNYVSVRDFDSYVNMLRGMPPSSCAMQGKCGGYFTVEADGSVYPCDFYVTDEYRIGNICDESFFTLAKSDKLSDFITSSVCVSEKCRACKWFKLCRGGCRRHREHFSGVTKFCEGYAYFFDTCYEKMRKIAQLVSNSSNR